jgi:hypothetical protein
VPTAVAIIAKVKIRKIHNGHFGTEATVSIPKIAGVLTLKCPDGKILARADELFADGTHLEAKLVQPCIPTN